MPFFHKQKPTYPHLNDDGTIDLDESCFVDFLAKTPKAIVMFHRTTCGHSVNMYPVFADLCREMIEMKFCKVSTPTNMNLVHQYNIKGTPTFVIFINKESVESVAGEIGKDALKAKILQRLSQ